MRRFVLVSSAVALLLALAAAAAVAGQGGLLDRTYRPLAGKTPVDLQATYGGDVVLVVNTASKCGFTPQFEALPPRRPRRARPPCSMPSRTPWSAPSAAAAW